MTLRCYGAGLFGWGRFQPSWGYDFNGHALVVGSKADPVLVVDPVEPSEVEWPALEALGGPFVVVLLNADHERASARVAARLKATVYAPRADVPLLRHVQAQPLDDGDALPGGWRVVALESLKTPGESALYHPGRKVLVLGDAIIGDPVTGLRLVPPAKLPDQARALASVSTLLTLDFETLLLSDGLCIPQGGKAALAGFLRREGFVLD